VPILNRALIACFPFILGASLAAQTAASSGTAPYLNPRLPINVRVDDLVSRMTLEEKASQLVNQSREIPRLKVPAYDWWSEALHGVARAGVGTVFPEPIGLAATFDPPLIHDMATVIGVEARAKHNQAIRAGKHDIYTGLDFWSPNINIFRDPRWGRGQETYGEDPFLTSRMGVAFVTGLQGDDPKYFQVISTPKHFAVHSGPEPSRHSVNVDVTKRDMQDTYLPAFRATITEGKAGSTMCAYNRVNGEPACTNSFLLEDELRGAWKFTGYVVSDCDAVADIQRGHHFTETMAEAAAVSLKRGMDNECADYLAKVAGNSDYVKFIDAVKQGLLTEKDIDISLKRLFAARFRLGLFDPPEMVKYARTPDSEIDSAAHRQLALKTARESIVLLKNDGILPLGSGVKNIAVIGPLAQSSRVLLGNYNGDPSKSTTALDGIRAQFAGAHVTFTPGTNFLMKDPKTGGTGDSTPDTIAAAVSATKQADVVIAVVGITSDLEGEEMEVVVPGFKGGDRTSLDLPKPEEDLLEALKACGKPLVVVLMNGSALSVNWANENANAILDAWYSGEEGGTAIAETLAGVNNPAGRLPVTFYKSVDQLPPFEDYSMKNRTYRYFEGQPLYPFGYGLSYSKFEYNNLKLSSTNLKAGDSLSVDADVKNASEREGDEVVQLYLSFPKAASAQIHALRGVSRIHLKGGETKHVHFTLDARGLSAADSNGDRMVSAGTYAVSVGGGQPRTGAPQAKEEFSISGEQRLPD
jgi:beta-glucosidase